MPYSEFHRPCDDGLCPAAIKSEQHELDCQFAAEDFENDLDELRMSLRVLRLAACTLEVSDDLKEQCETQAMLLARQVALRQEAWDKQQRPLYDMARVRMACFENNYTETKEGQCFRYCGSLALNEEQRDESSPLADQLPSIQ